MRSTIKCVDGAGTTRQPASHWRMGSLILVATLLLTACTPDAATSPASQNSGKPNVVVTTTLAGDIVRQVGGDAIDLQVLLPVGADPHNFTPTPQEVAAVAEADVIFTVGLGLEAFMEPLLANAGSRAQVVALSDGIAALAPPAELPGAEETDDHAEETVDPHVWFDPNHVSTWVDNAVRALSDIDPAQAVTYQANAETYRQELQALDRWIVELVAAIPAAGRQLVTDHLIFSYFAQRYGFEQVGAVIPGYSTLSEPSAQELAALENAIRQTGVKAILVGNTVNPALAERVAGDTGTRLVQVYTDSLTAPGGEAESYLAFMRYNVRAIVDALK